MKNKKQRPVLLKDTTRSVLFFLVINLLAVISPMGLVVAPVVIPVMLLYILAQHGINAFTLAALAGVMPYFVLGGTEVALAMISPMILMTAVLYGIKKYQLKWRSAFFSTVLAIFLGLAISSYLSIYVIEGSDLGEFSTRIAENVKEQLKINLGSTTYELPMSQQQTIDELTGSITPQFVQDVIPSLLISWSMVGGYLTLRLARKYLKIGQTQQTHIPWFALVGINPLLLAGFIIMAIAGSTFASERPRLASLLFNTGYGVATFLGIVGTLSLIWWSLSVKFHFKGKITKIFLMLITLFYMSGDWMILVAIVDSVLDFRNISGKSLWRWMTYQVTMRLPGGD